MQTQQSSTDREARAYIQGRRDEQKDIYKALEAIRSLGFLDVNTCKIIIDHLAKIDQRENK
jgi:hypothetical protein